MAANNTLNIVINAVNKSKQAITDATKDLDSLKNTAISVKSVLGGVVGIVFGSAVLKNLIDTADKWLSLNAQIRTATSSSEEFTVSQQAVLDISRKTYTSLEANAGLFSKVNLAIKAMGGNTQQSIQTVDQIAKLVALSGTSAESAAAGIFQFTQSLAANRFSGQEYNSVAEQTPALLKAIYEGLNVNIGTLRKMAEEGQLDTQTVLRALENSTARTDAAFAKLPVTFSKATQNMSNAWITLVGRLNESTGVTGNLAAGLNYVADNLETIVVVSAKLGAGALIIGFSRLSQVAAGYTKSLIDNVNAERAAQKAEIESAEAKVARKTAFLDSAKIKAQEANANAALVRSNLALIKSDIDVEQQKLRLALANQAMAKSQLAAVRSTFGAGSQAEANALRQLNTATTAVNASQSRLAAVSAQSAAAQKTLTAAVAAQSQAQRVVATSTQFQIAAQEQLNAVTAQSSVLMTRLKTGLSSVTSFLGGGFGVALLGLYAAYEAMEALTDSTEKAEAKAKLFEERLNAVNDSIKAIKTPDELSNKLSDAEMNAEVLRMKIAELEQFSFDNIGNIWGNAGKRAALQSDLDLNKKTIEAINDRQNELIRSFDVLSLSPKQLNDELAKTTDVIDQLKAEIATLKEKEKNGALELYEIESLKKDEARLNAFQAKAKAINQQLGKEANSPEGFKKQLGKAEELNAINKTAYERDVRNLEQAEQAKLAIISQSKLSERDKLNQSVATEIEFNSRKLQATVQYQLQRLQMTEQMYAREIDINKKRNLSTEQLEKDANNAKKSILLELEKSYETSISKLDALDKQHRDKAVAYLKEIEGQEQSKADRLKQLDQIGLSQTELAEQRKKQILQDTAKVKELINQGEYAKAVELSKKLQDLTFEQAQATKQAAAEANANVSGSGNDFAAKQARDQYTESVKLTEQALKQAAQAETLQADTAKANADKQREALAKVEEQLQNIDGILTKSSSLNIKVDTAEIDAAKRAIDAIPSEKVVTIKTVGDSSPATNRGYAGGGLVVGEGTTTSDSILAWLSNKEFIVKAKSVASVGLNTLHYINQHGKLPAFKNGGSVGSQVQLPSFLKNQLSSIQAPNFMPQSKPVTTSGNNGETITLNLTLGGNTATGKFQNNDALQQIVTELQRQKRAMG